MVRTRFRYKPVIIGTLITGITLLHFAPLASGLGTHLLHRELYFFPILLAGFWYGLKGGVGVAACISVIYAGQFILADTFRDVVTAVISQDLVFLAVGLFLGAMVDRQKRQRRERDQIRTRLAEERLQKRAMNIQLETATKIQSLFRPQLPSPGSGSHVWADSRPAKFVGGDLYDIIPMPDESWIVYVADVSDKGLPAALIMAALWYRIRSEAPLQGNVGELLTALNKPLYDLVSKEGYFVTIFIGRYWPDTGRLEFANGGHPPALKMDRKGWQRIDGRRGMSLGVVENSTYKTESTMIGPDEAIFLMTDGITEAVDAREIQGGLEKIYKCAREQQGPPWGPALLKRIHDCGSHTHQTDDLTLLEIWRESEAAHISRKARTAT